jgi:HD-like signal output (HDOD) protein/CheY-like chemotaxis protein
VRRILFVDDQQEILKTHRQSMQKYSGQVEMMFAVGAEAAMDVVRSERVDIVVTDMHMPGVDGAMLLGAIKEDHPHIVRVMLCPQSETDSILVALPVSHQILAQPMVPEALWNAIERIYQLRELLTDSLRKKIGGMQQLPSAPTVYFEMMAAMARTDVSAQKITRILEKDAAMAAKTLQVVNSACFCLSRTITRLDQAVAYLGMELIRDLSLTVHMFAALEPTAIRSGFSFDAEQEHSLLTARVARRLVSNPRHAQQAFTAALLHDVGNLVMAVCIPEKFKLVTVASKTSGRSSHEVETELLGVTHAEVGAYLLGLWGVPHPIVEAVAYHHNPSAAMERSFDIPTVVAVANGLVDEIVFARTFPSAIEEHLESLKVIDKLPRWAGIAREELQSQTAIVR